MNGFEIVGFLGEGSFSSTFKVRKNDDQMYFILKKMKYHADDENEKKSFRKNFQKFAIINHPNIIKYHDMVYDEKEKCFW